MHDDDGGRRRGDGLLRIDGLLNGYEFDKYGSIVDDTIQPGGANINVWTVHSFAHPLPQLPDYIYFGSIPRVPRGTQVTIEGHTFIADAESDDGDVGDRWDFPSGELPASLVWSAGQEVTVSVKLASPCDNLDNLVNAIVVKNLTGEITQAGESQFHRIRLDPYRSYLIEAIGQVGEDMLGVEEHPNLTLSNPDIPAIWNAKATSRWITYGDSNDGDESKNVIRRFLRTGYRTYKVEVASGNNGTGTYQLKIRVNNICRINDEGNTQYQWAGGPEGYPADSDLPAGTGGRQVLLAGTDWGNNNVTRPELHHVLGDNWDSNPDEDWFGVDLEQGKEYTVRLRTKTNLPERLQDSSQHRPLLHRRGFGRQRPDRNEGGHPAQGPRHQGGQRERDHGTASAEAAGKKVYATGQLPAPAASTSPWVRHERNVLAQHPRRPPTNGKQRPAADQSQPSSRATNRGSTIQLALPLALSPTARTFPPTEGRRLLHQKRRPIRLALLRTTTFQTAKAKEMHEPRHPQTSHTWYKFALSGLLTAISL